ncbi:transposase family protein [Rickettsia hoogstraalii str. RCCE3]|nr:transposase family protein [Rickettsia hoogstraalii str. RCCE3]
MSVVNPYFTSAFRTMRGKFTKTDTIDAQMLALFVEKINPESRKVANEIEKELKEYNGTQKLDKKIEKSRYNIS